MQGSLDYSELVQKVQRIREKYSMFALQEELDYQLNLLKGTISNTDCQQKRLANISYSLDGIDVCRHVFQSFMVYQNIGTRLSIKLLWKKSLLMCG